MKKIISNFIALIVAVSAGYHAVGTMENKEAKATVLELWSTYNTVRVMQEKHDYQKLEAKVNIVMAKGETESSQIFMTPEKDVQAFDFKVQDLSYGENIIPKENIKVYKQNYVNVTTKTYQQENEEYPVGMTPDFLLPLDVAKEYKENNIEKNKNQGITIEITTTSETKSGNYSGNFILEADGENFNIPVNVKVYDVDISENVGLTSFGMNYNNPIMQGELDNTSEKYQQYFDFLLDYRVVGNISSAFDTMEEYFSFLSKYYDDPRLSSIGIPIFRGSSKYVLNERLFSEAIEELLKYCKPNLNLFEKAYSYIVPIDEPHDEESFAAVRNYRNSIENIIQNIIKEMEENGYYDSFKNDFDDSEIHDFKNSLESAMTNLDQLITTSYNFTLQDNVKTYCPTIDRYDISYEKELYADNAEKNDTRQWWYHCMNPIYPYPSFHIDDYLIGSRIQGWMQQAYDVSGFLYWETSLDKAEPSEDCVDPYTNPNRFAFQGKFYPGDGYLLYPGKKYSSETPFPSMRLLSFRDGQEDLALLKKLEEKYELLNNFYATDDITLNNAISDIYSQLFEGTKYNSNSETFANCRQKIFDLLNIDTSSDKFVVASAQTKNLTATLQFYTAIGYTAEVNGQEVMGSASGQGKKYVLNSDISIQNATYDIKIYDKDKNVVENKIIFVSERTYQTKSYIENMFELKNTDTDSVVIKDGQAKISIVSKADGTLLENSSYDPYFILSQSAFEEEILKIKDLKITLTNNGESALKIRIRLQSKNGTGKTMQEIAIAKGATITVTLQNIYLTDWAQLSNVNGIKFLFDNLDSTGNPMPLRNLTLDRIYYTLAAV